MIKIENLSITVPGFNVHDINIEIAPGEFFVLLGPTGAGKTLVLEAVAGLTPASSGNIYINSRNATNLPPEERKLGVVYQESALFPHLNVRKNIAYGLRYHDLDPMTNRNFIEDLVKRLNIEHLLDRSVEHLSGGEKQRTALARALAVRPAALLLDEPLSALDPAFREEIRKIIKELHRELGMTFLMVTHDFTEALFLAERAAVMSKGGLEQIGNAQEIFRNPKSPFVAGFIGMKNIFPASFDNGLARLDQMDIIFERSSCENTSPTHIGIRPEDINVAAESDSNGDINAFPGEITCISSQGLFYELTVKIQNTTFCALTPGSSLLQNGLMEGSRVIVHISPDHVHAF